jgi:hypothetical protein
MVRTHIVLVSLLLAQSSYAKSPLGPRTLVIPKGTVLKFATVADLSSETAKKGDPIPLRLTRPLMVDGVTLLAEGTPAQGRVTKVKRAAKNCKDGSLEWDIDRVSFPDSSVALTELYLRASWPGAPVPENISSRAIRRGRHDKLKTGLELVALSPLIAPVALAFAPWMIAVLVAPDPDGKSIPCGYPGSEYHFPAQSTVGVAIAENHRVRY